MQGIRSGFALLLFGVAAASGTPQVRICLQWIEVPERTLTAFLEGTDTRGAALHDRVFTLTREGKARLVETSMVVATCGTKSSVESVREEIYPTEYPSGGSPWNVPPTAEQLASIPPVNPIYRSITAFETRNAGLTFEIEPTLSPEGFINLQMTSEIVTPMRLETWMEHVDSWGDASIRMPIYETWRTCTAVDLAPGKFELISSHTPLAGGKIGAVGKRILLFVRSDEVPTESHP